jgi:hypothetical protein
MFSEKGTKLFVIDNYKIGLQKNLAEDMIEYAKVDIY